MRSKAARLSSDTEESSAVDKLRQEIREYREILKCSICLDRRKEVCAFFYMIYAPAKQRLLKMVDSVACVISHDECEQDK